MKELRIILTVDNLEEMIEFYRDTMELKTSLSWDTQTGRGIILEAGKASLELIDSRHAEFIDKMEVGSRTSGPVRLAFNVGKDNILAASAKYISKGATKISEAKQAPWSKVMRLQDPSGMQLTLFETSTLFKEEEPG